MQTTTAQIQEFWNTLISSDLIKEVVTTFGNIVELLTDVNKTFGSLPIVIIAVTEALIALRGTQIANFFASATITTNTFAASVIGLQAALGVVAIAFVAVAKVIQMHNKEIEEAKRRQDEFKQGTEELQELLQRGTKDQLDNRIETLKKLAEQYGFLTKRLSELKMAEADINTATEEGVDALLKNRQAQSELEKEIDKLEDTFEDYATSGENAFNTIRKLEAQSGKLREEEFTLAKQQDLLTRAMQELNTQGEIAGDTFAELIERFPEIAEQLSINEDAVKSYAEEFENMTNAQILIEQELTKVRVEETKKRIMLLQTELAAIEDKVRAQMAELGRPDPETLRLLSAAQIGMREQISALEDLQSKTKALDIVSKERNKTSKKNTDSTKELTQAQRDLLKVEQDIALIQEEAARVEGVSRINYIGQLITKEKERQDTLKKVRGELETLRDSEGKLIHTGDELLEQQRKYDLEIQKSTTTLMEYGDEILSINKDQEEFNEELEKANFEKLQKDVKKYTDELKKSAKDSLDKFKKSEKKKLEAVKNRLEAEIQAIEDQKEELAREETEEDFLAKKKEVEEQITQLEKEQTGLRFSESDRDKKRLFELEGELADARLELNTLVNDREAELRQQALDDKKDILQQELDDEEEASQERIEKRVEEYEQILEELEDFEDEWKSIGEAFGEAFDEGMRPKLEAILDTLEDIAQEAGVEIDIPDRPKKKKPPTEREKNIADALDKPGMRPIEREGMIIGWEKLETGGTVTGTGMVQLDGKPGNPELVLNSDQIDRVGSVMGLNGNTMQMSQQLFGMANNIPAIQPMGGATASTTIGSLITVENISVSGGAGYNNDINRIGTDLARSALKELSRNGIRLR